MNDRYDRTIYASFVGFIVQAIINNFAPLLFLTFQRSYGISFNAISALITVNFCVQLLVDLLSARFIDRIGHRRAIVAAHICCALGLIGLAVLPELLPVPFWGLVIAVSVYAIGGGIMEVLISPIVESCPTKNKESVMSLLHSFYCWGHVAVVLLSTAFFTLAGIENWKLLAFLWAIIPAANALVFARVPIPAINAEDGSGMPVRQLFGMKLFWIMFVMMLCAGASEHGVAQWASAFAESALGIPKAVGDLAGPLSFAVLMGGSRMFYAKFGGKISLENFMVGSAVLCVISYLLAALSPSPVVSFIGCALCGLSVGIMWPGTLSIAAARIPRGGTAMFALFALAGDVGCSVGPALVGAVSDARGDMKRGILCAVVFPVVLLLALAAKRRCGTRVG